MKGILKSITLPLLASLTLGLAPFFPEPHIVGKITWVLGGARGMELMDWLDLAFHGFPLVWLIIMLFTSIYSMLKNRRLKTVMK